jgi:hypothetical protein
MNYGYWYFLPTGELCYELTFMVTDVVIYSSPTFRSKKYLVITGDNNMYLRFPIYSENTMYKGMECGEHYTLQELGL